MSVCTRCRRPRPTTPIPGGRICWRCTRSLGDIYCTRCKGYLRLHGRRGTCPTRAELRAYEAHEDRVEAQYKEAYGPDADKLATYNAEGR